jgi:hypothetical protein
LQIIANLAIIKQQIKDAAVRSGRDYNNVTLVAVTKTHPFEIIIEAHQAGLRHFGENRADEFAQKVINFNEWLTGEDLVTWHYVGHLQTRQVNQILASRPGLLHGVDSLKLAERINRLATSENYPPVEMLLQCDVSGESTKSGFELSNWSTDQARLDDFIENIKYIVTLDKVVILGLMTMAPYYDDPEKARPVFQSLARLKTRLQQELPHVDLYHLSMGMTNDFEVAIEEGATIVRIGRAIFGERD